MESLEDSSSLSDFGSEGRIALFRDLYSLEPEEQEEVLGNLSLYHLSLTAQEFKEALSLAFCPKKAREDLKIFARVVLCLLDALPTAFALVNFDKEDLVFGDRPEDLAKLARVQKTLSPIFLPFLRVCLVCDVGVVREVAAESLEKVAGFVASSEWDAEILPIFLEFLDTPEDPREAEESSEESSSDPEDLLLESEISPKNRNVSSPKSSGKTNKIKSGKPAKQGKIAASSLGGQLLLRFGRFSSSLALDSRVAPVLLARDSLWIFFGLFEYFSAEFVWKGQARLARWLAEGRVEAIGSLSHVAARLGERFFEGPILALLTQLLTKGGPISWDLSAQLGPLLASLLDSCPRAVVVRGIPILLPLLRTFFNLPEAIIAAPETTRLAAVQSSWTELTRVITRLGQGGWPLLDRLFFGLERAEPGLVLERAKLVLAPQLPSLFKLALAWETDSLDSDSDFGGSTDSQKSNTCLSEKLLRTIQKLFLQLNPKTPVSVKFAATLRLPEILELSPPLLRVPFAEHFVRVSGSVSSWRDLYKLSIIFPRIVPLFPPSEIIGCLVPLFFNLCRADAAIVKTTIAPHFHILAKEIFTNSSENGFLLKELVEALGTAQSFRKRLVFLDLYKSLTFNEPELVWPEVNHIFEKIVEDRVINVRLKAAIVSAYLTKAGKATPVVEKAIERFRKEEVLEIKDIFSEL